MGTYLFNFWGVGELLLYNSTRKHRNTHKVTLISVKSQDIV